ncbi:phage tail tube protein [Streptomyces pseudovenezuelae]|uniref:phage tail tube protein n=1 Tax=Streptomyces pseudovenezuelae TaxID=67350 RepID=UPI0036E939FB
MPTIASTALLPTRAEISAGTDLTDGVRSIDGWSLENQPIETPDMGSTFVSKIDGDDAAADSSLGFYEDNTLDDIETDLAKGTTGFICIFSKGDVPGGKGLDVFPVKVASNSKAYSTDNEAAQINVQFVITDRPAFNQTVPAAGTDEVQTVTITGGPTGGTYTLTFNSQTTSAIPYNATSSQVQTALEALSNIAPGDVTCAGGPHPTTPITVNFGGGAYDGADVPQMTASGSFTGGTSPAIAVTTTTPGG